MIGGASGGRVRLSGVDPVPVAWHVLPRPAAWVVRGVYALAKRYNAHIAFSPPICLYSICLAIYGAYTGRVVYVVGDFPIYA